MKGFNSVASKYGVFSGPYFPVFRLNTEIYGPEKLRIWTLFMHAILVYLDLATFEFSTAVSLLLLLVPFQIQIFSKKTQLSIAEGKFDA